jgi:hypothetical protein
MRRRRVLLLPPGQLLRPNLLQLLVLRADHPQPGMRAARQPLGMQAVRRLPVTRAAPPRPPTTVRQPAALRLIAPSPPAMRTEEQPLPIMALQPPAPALRQLEGVPVEQAQGEQPAEERAGPAPMRAGEREEAILHQQEAMRLTPQMAARCAHAPTASGAMSTTLSAEWIFIMGWPADGGFL